METKRRRNDGNPYGVSVVGDGISLPDYANFKSICDEVGKELGLNGKEVYKIYGRFIDRSLSMLLPEPDLRTVTDESLLTPKRSFSIPFIGVAEVTRKSLAHFRKMFKLTNK